MLARHPLTGKDIRIISLDTSVSKESKTIVWFDKVPAEAGRWNRYDIGACSVSVAKSLISLGLTPDVILCDDSDETLEWFRSSQATNSRILAIPKTFVARIGLERLMALRLGNLICLDEVHDMYPFVGGKWDGSGPDAQLLLTMILQKNRVRLTAPFETQRPLRNLRIEDVKEPQPLWWITQYYVPEKSSRRSEIQQCLAKNLASPLIDKVVLLNETACAPKHKKIEEHVVGKRITYADVIRWIAEKVPADTLVAFANADIFLDGDSWRNLWAADLETQAKFFALLRWDTQGVGQEEIAKAAIFSNSSGPPRVDSQDTWIVASNAVKATTWDWSTLNFPFGKGGCDNAITVEMFKKRFLIANPALTLKTFHLHASGVRGYNPADIVDKPVYLYISPSGLHDKKPVTDISTLSDKRPFTFKPFDRKLKGPLTPAQARTFCTMVARSTQGEVNLTVEGDNTWAPPPVSFYRLKDVFQTRDGLAYSHESILLGSTKAGARAWSESQVSYLAAAINVDDAMIAPLSDEVASKPARFILEYMAKVFLLREVFGSTTGEFWCSKNETMVDTLKMFAWPSREIPVLSRDENQQTWCSAAAMWPHQDTPQGFISQEEVKALRDALGMGWKEAAGKRLVIVVDAKWLTDEVADELEHELEMYNLDVKIVWAGRTSLETILQSFCGAWGAIMFDQSFAAWSWVLPRGAFLWDIQSEMEPSASLLHLASAAGLEHRLTIVPRGSNDVEKKALVAKLFDSIRGEFQPPSRTPTGSPTAKKPKIFMPKGHTGFYAHAGDSFREIASLWAERGYVDLVPSPAHQVWLYEVGDTLLYDRPTHQWWEQAPPREQTFRKALFGNPAPPPGGKPWSFWPRRPALVENAVAAGLPKRTWESRDQTVVFYGRSENAVQKSRRTTADWSTACSEFIHVDGLSKYPYTAEEYLERLAAAKYGLCLAGYGYKCHREIECMAMGTVPIVAPEVDMSNYANPPEEGLHYLRVASPEEVGKVVADITGERWTVMSNACRDWWVKNASVDGMWALTQRLTQGSAPSP